jgi:acetyl-CoA acetyltransferase
VGRARGFSSPVGDVDRSKLNVMGGSISIGHPFGATGGRILTTLCNELARAAGSSADDGVRRRRDGPRDGRGARLMPHFDSSTRTASRSSRSICPASR